MVGVDVGGTKVVAGRVTRDGRLSGEPQVVPSGTRDVTALVDSIVEAVGAVLHAAASAGESASGVGIGCAGTVDAHRGVVVTSPHLPLIDTPVAALVGGHVGLPVLLDNDVNAAVWAEAQVGAARGCRHVVMLALGTGVGGGLVLDGRLYRGATGAAAELGHMIVVPDGEPCRCGARGCLETYASGRALERIARGLVHDLPEIEARALRAADAAGTLTGRAVGDLALSGDPGALRAVEEVGRWLGIGLSNVVNIFDPEMIVVGGGAGNLGELLLAPARAVVKKTALAPGRDRVRVTSALLGNEAGMLGAGLLAWAGARARS